MDLRGVDLNLLVSLDALLAERNVTLAARRLGLSQPAVSAQLNHLRRLFNDPLLVPQRRGMAPTGRALELARPLKAMLGGVEAFIAERAAFDPATTTLTVRIATTDAIQYVLGVPLVERLRAQAPSLRVALLRADSRTIEGAFEAGALDLVMVTPGYLAPHWRTRRLMTERFACLLRRGHPAAGRPLDLETFCALDHLMVSPDGGGFAGAVDAALASVGRSRHVALSVQDFLIVPALLERTDLIATMPARLSRSFPKTLKVLQPPLEVVGFAVDMAWHPRTHTDTAQQWLRAQAVEVAKSI